MPATRFLPELVEFMIRFPEVLAATEHTHLPRPSGNCAGCSGELTHVRYPCVHVQSAREARKRLSARRRGTHPGTTGHRTNGQRQPTQ